MFQNHYICRVYKLIRKGILNCAVSKDPVGSQYYETSWCECRINTIQCQTPDMFRINTIQCQTPGIFRSNTIQCQTPGMCRSNTIQCQTPGMCRINMIQCQTQYHATNNSCGITQVEDNHLYCKSRAVCIVSMFIT